MNNIKLWAFTLCASSMIAAIFEVLTPQSQKRQLTYIVQMFLLLCLIAPVAGYTNDKPNIDITSLQMQAIEAIDTDFMLKEQFRQRLTEMISNKLETLGIFPREIRIDFSVSENTIDVTKAVILLEPEDKQKLPQTKQELESFLGIAVEAALYGEVK